MRRYTSSKKYQGEKYLRDRNLLVSSATLRLTEEIKRKARRTQIKEESKRALRLSLDTHWYPVIKARKQTTISSFIWTTTLVTLPLKN
jgi:hypothetical protein